MVKVTCIRKDQGNHENPHEGITGFGWVNEQSRATGESTRSQMVDFLEKQNGKAYVKDSLGNVAYVGIITSKWGNKYLRTYSDGKWTDNLLSLLECR